MNNLQYPLLSGALRTAAFAIPVAWTFRLEKNDCACASSWKRDFVRYGFMLAIALTWLYRFVTLPDQRLWAFSSLFVFTLYVVTVLYITDLRAAKCECASNWMSRFSVWWIAVSVALVLLGRLHTIMNGSKPAVVSAPKKSSRGKRGRKN